MCLVACGVFIPRGSNGQIFEKYGTQSKSKRLGTLPITLAKNSLQKNRARNAHLNGRRLSSRADKVVAVKERQSRRDGRGEDRLKN